MVLKVLKVVDLGLSMVAAVVAIAAGVYEFALTKKNKGLVNAQEYAKAEQQLKTAAAEE